MTFTDTVADHTLSVAEAAERLGVSERTVWRYLKSGRLAGSTVGDPGSQRTLIDASGIDALVRSRTPGAADDSSARLAEATAQLERLQAECASLQARLRAAQRAHRDWRQVVGVDVVVALLASIVGRLRAGRSAQTA